MTHTKQDCGESRFCIRTTNVGSVFDPSLFSNDRWRERECTHGESGPDERSSVSVHVNKCHDLKVKWPY